MLIFCFIVQHFVACALYYHKCCIESVKETPCGFIGSYVNVLAGCSDLVRLLITLSLSGNTKLH